MSHTRHRRLEMSRPAGVPLPERYVAAKFYTGTALPDSAGHRRALRDLISVVARRMPVVVLDTGLKTDEHEDYLFQGLSNVCSVRAQLDPRTNLDMQTAVISGSRGFIGTCGSLAWLAPMLGIDTVAVYANDRFLASHIFFATHVYRQNGAARFDTLDLRGVMDLDLMEASESMVAASRPQ
jgi:ADP-heptose:LPS heptosyltransferase